MPYKGSEKERAGGRRRYERITAERTARGMCARCGKARPAPDQLVPVLRREAAPGRTRKVREGQGSRHTLRWQRCRTVPLERE